jgi:membrane fusion protein
MNLFRREAIEARRRRLWGEVRLSQPPSLLAWSVTLGGTALAILGALAFGSHVRKETVGGYLSPEGGMVQLAAPRAGRITRVLVREGERVSVNAPLIEFSGESTGAQTGQVLAAQLAQVEQQLTSVRQRGDASESTLRAEQARLRHQLAAQLARRELLAQRIADQAELVRFSGERSARLDSLADSGYLSRVQLDERRQQFLAQRGELRALEGEAAAVQGGIEELRSQVREWPARLAALHAGTELELSTLLQKRIELSSARRFVERAPVAGIVASLQAAPGQVPAANAPLLSLMPEGATLLAELLVPTRAAGFIRPGDEVRLQIEAFPFERFGFVMGHVISAPRSVLKPGEFLAPIEIREAVYRVRVALGRDHVIAYGRRLPLQPGMVLRADIVIDRRPLWRQLVDPLLAAARRAH